MGGVPASTWAHRRIRGPSRPLVCTATREHTLAASCASSLGSVPRKLTLAAAKEQPLSARLNTHDQRMSLTVRRQPATDQPPTTPTVGEFLNARAGAFSSRKPRHDAEFSRFDLRQPQLRVPHPSLFAFLSIQDLAVVLEHLSRSNIARVLVQQIRISPFPPTIILFKEAISFPSMHGCSPWMTAVPVAFAAGRASDMIFNS